MANLHHKITWQKQNNQVLPHRHSKSVSLATDPIYYHHGLAAINLRHLQYCLLLICFRIIRAPDRDLFHQYHDKKCDPSLSEEQYRSCLGSKAKVEGTHTQIAIQLTKLREKYEPESQSENGYWDQTIERNKCQPRDTWPSRGELSCPHEEINKTDTTRDNSRAGRCLWIQSWTESIVSMATDHINVGKVTKCCVCCNLSGNSNFIRSFRLNGTTILFPFWMECWKLQQIVVLVR